MREPLIFRISSWPPSLNHSHHSMRRKRFRTDETKRWMHDAHYEIRAQVEPPGFPIGDPLELTLTFVGPWCTKTNRAASPFKRTDVSNLIKVTEDAIATALLYDDRQNFDIHIHKRPSEHEKHIEVRLERAPEFQTGEAPDPAGLP